MAMETKVAPNVKQAVPFFMVSNMEASLRFYIDGLGFRMVNKWIDEGKPRCRSLTCLTRAGIGSPLRASPRCRRRRCFQNRTAEA